MKFYIIEREIFVNSFFKGFFKVILDELVKSPFCPIFVIPAKAGIQGFL